MPKKVPDIGEGCVPRYQVLLSLMSCSAGGVFMGTCILDLFPDVQQQLDLLLDQTFSTQSYPVAEFIVVFGFLLVLTMEQVVLDYKEQSLLNRSVFLFTPMMWSDLATF